MATSSLFASPSVRFTTRCVPLSRSPRLELSGRFSPATCPLCSRHRTQASLLLLHRRASGAQRPALVLRSCRPRSSGFTGNPFFRMAGMGPEAWGGSASQQKAWQEMAKAAEQAFGPEATRGWQQAAETVASAVAFPVDIEESETEYVLTADIPGLAKGDLKIRVKEETRELTISGERRRAKASAAATEGADSQQEAAPAFEGKRTYERRMGKFERTFKLSAKADPNAVSARVDWGVLTLTVLKLQRDEPQVKEVPIWD